MVGAVGHSAGGHPGRASIELALTATALVDLVRRPAAEVRGPKGLWALGVFVQPVGPIGYLTCGRHRG